MSRKIRKSMRLAVVVLAALAAVSAFSVRSARSAPARSNVPAKLVEWGMDQQLWNKIENKRNFIKMVNRANRGSTEEEQFARARISKLRTQLIDTPQMHESVVAADTAADVAADAGAAAAEVAAEMAEAEETLLEVVCPELPADRTIRVALPDGREFDVAVPPGVATGAAFLVGPFPRAEARAEAIAELTDVESTAAEQEAELEPTPQEKHEAAVAAAAKEAETKRQLSAAPRATITAVTVAAARGLLAIVGGEESKLAAAEARARAEAAQSAQEDLAREAALAAVVSRIAEIDALASPRTRSEDLSEAALR